MRLWRERKGGDECWRDKETYAQYLEGESHSVVFTSYERQRERENCSELYLLSVIQRRKIDGKCFGWLRNAAAEFLYIII